MNRVYLLLFCVLPFWCMGQVPEPMVDTYVNDHTNSLSEEQVFYLNQQLRTLETRSSVQVAILLIHRLPATMSLEEYARTVGNQWKVGNAFNGLVYVAVLQERKHRLEVARTLEATIPDAIAATIIDKLKPHLKSAEYFQALQTLIEQLGYYLDVPKEELAASPDFWPLPQSRTSIIYTPNTEDAEWNATKARYEKYGNWVIIGLIIGAFFFVIWAWIYKRKYIAQNTVNGVYLGMGTSYFSTQFGHHYRSGSGGGASGFGGFGGSGGGGFSGGGASGSW